jgi:hypothetical protein
MADTDGIAVVLTAQEWALLRGALPWPLVQAMIKLEQALQPQPPQHSKPENHIREAAQ